MAKVIGHSVHQQMVPRDDSEQQNVFALFVSLVISQLTKLFHAVVRRKPNRQLFAVEFNDLTLHEGENSLGRINHRNFPIFRSNEMFIGNAVEPVQIHALGEAGHLEVWIVFKILLSNAVESRLHGPSRDFGELEEKSRERKNDDNGDEEFFYIFPNARIRVRLKPFSRGFLQLLHLFVKLFFPGPFMDCSESLGARRVDRGNGFWRK